MIVTIGAGRDDISMANMNQTHATAFTMNSVIKRNILSSELVSIILKSSPTGSHFTNLFQAYNGDGWIYFNFIRNQMVYLTFLEK